MSRRNKKVLGLLCFAMLLPCANAQAQLAPTPQRSPRTPVNQQLLFAPAPALPTSRLVEGPAVILDSEHVKIDKIEMRLFGVVPPLLSASFGPQARTVIDALATGAVTCRVRDRDREGHLLASCHNGENLDFGMELLRRGLAVTARGTLHGTELAATYAAAEDAAKKQHLGLWSVSSPNAASTSSIRQAAQDKPADAKPETKMTETAPPALPPANATEIVVPVSQNTMQAPTPQAKPNEPVAPPPALQPEILAKAQQQTTQEILDAYPTAEDGSDATPDSNRGFVEKYQLLLTGLLIFGAASMGAFGFVFNRRQERKQETSAIAAALRGELMAARSICLARLSKMAHDGDERVTAWPRIRSLVFQAYVGQLGKLGADLARQIASIYGQASDYASYYVGAKDRPEAASKKQSLQTLVQHIEDIMPQLTSIERSGLMPLPGQSGPQPRLSLWGRVVRPLALLAPNMPKITAKEKAPAKAFPALESQKERADETAYTAAEEQSTPEPEAFTEPSPSKKFREAPIVEEEKEALQVEPTATVVETAKEEAPREESTVSQEPTIKAMPPKAPVPPRHPSRRHHGRNKAPIETKAPSETVETKPTPSAAASRAATEALAAVAAAAVATPRAKAKEIHPVLQAAQEIDLKTTLAERFSRLKSFAQDKWGHVKPKLSSSIEDIIPDYANLTEEELEALSYEDDDFFLDDYSETYRRAG